MSQLGFDIDPTLSADELYDWWAQLLSDIIVDPQPGRLCTRHSYASSVELVPFRIRIIRESSQPFRCGRVHRPDSAEFGQHLRGPGATLPIRERSPKIWMGLASPSQIGAASTMNGYVNED